MPAGGSLVGVPWVSCLGNNQSHIKDCLFCFKTDWKAVELRLCEHSLRRLEQKGNHPRRIETGFRKKTHCHRKLCSVPCSLLAEIRLRLGEGVPWPGCDPEGHWTVTSNEICEWKEVKLNLVRILKNIRGLKGKEGERFTSPSNWGKRIF